MTAASSSAFPRLQLGRLLHYIFRGLLSVHLRYNLQTRQVALCDPLLGRLGRLCCLHRRSDCYRVERSSSRAGLSPAVVQCLSRRTVIACLRQPFADQFVFAEGCQTNTAHPPSAFAPINLFAAFFSCVGRESPNSSLRLEADPAALSRCWPAEGTIVPLPHT